MQIFFAAFFAFFILANAHESKRELSILATKKPLKILVYSTSLSWSHAQFLGKIADTLQEAGHEVHFLKFIGAAVLDSKNETKLVKNVRIVRPRKSSTAELDVKNMEGIAKCFSGQWPILNAWPKPAWISFFESFSAPICKDMVQNKELLDELEAEHFDAGIAEVYDLCPFAIFHKIGVRSLLGTNAVPVHQLAARRFGIPTFSSFVPNHFVRSMDGPNFGFLGRLINFYDDLFDWLVVDKVNVELEQPYITAAFGPQFPRLEQIVRNVSLYLVNSNPLFQLPRPISNKVVHIGGIVNPPVGNGAAKLDKKIRTILDKSRDGAILVSFGSLAETSKMSRQMKMALIETFSRFPSIVFLWKMDAASQRNDSALFAKAKNVHTFEWLPQSVVLNHPKMRAFISHCGWNSVSEAAQMGVPVLGVPLFADQRHNLLVAKHHGMGLFVDVKQLNEPGAEELMAKALEKILHDPSYHRNAQMVKRKLALSPFSGPENLIRWVEFAAQFGDLNEMNLPGDAELGWIAYYSVDAILFTIAILLGVLAIFALVLWKIGSKALTIIGGEKMKNKEE